MVATPAMAWLGRGPLRPAAAKASGTTTATPSPISAKPAMAAGGLGARTTSTPPSVARIPPARTVRTAPKRSTTRSPASLASAMVRAKAVVEPAAAPGEVFRVSRRKTADQSRLPPSAKTAQKPTAPMINADFGGSVNRGGAASSGAL